MLPQHQVQFIDDRQMPDGHDWLMIEAGDAIVCVVRKSKVCPEVLEEAWSGYRDLIAS